MNPDISFVNMLVEQLVDAKISHIERKYNELSRVVYGPQLSLNTLFKDGKLCQKYIDSLDTNIIHKPTSSIVKHPLFYIILMANNADVSEATISSIVANIKPSDIKLSSEEQKYLHHINNKQSSSISSKIMEC